MVSVDTGSVYVTNSSSYIEANGGDTINVSGSEKVVRISTGDAGPLDHDLDKTLGIQIDVPSTDTPAQGGTETPTKRIKDLNQVNEAITVTGYIAEESSTSSLSKKNDLRTLAQFAGQVAIVWGKSSASEQQYYEGFIKKINWKENPGRIIETGKTIDGTSPERHFLVTLVIIVAEAI